MSRIASRLVFATLVCTLQLAACGDGSEDGSSMSHQSGALMSVAANDSAGGDRDTVRGSESPTFE
jgi:hypothetical protein